MLGLVKHFVCLVTQCKILRSDCKVDDAFVLPQASFEPQWPTRVDVSVGQSPSLRAHGRGVYGLVADPGFARGRPAAKTQRVGPDSEGGFTVTWYFL
jgi:hypothetical protein